MHLSTAAPSSVIGRRGFGAPDGEGEGNRCARSLAFVAYASGQKPSISTATDRVGSVAEELRSWVQTRQSAEGYSDDCSAYKTHHE